MWFDSQITCHSKVFICHFDVGPFDLRPKNEANRITSESLGGRPREFHSCFVRSDSSTVIACTDVISKN